MEINMVLANVLVAVGVGMARSALGYLAVIQKEYFDGWKFMQGAIIGAVGGSVAGIVAQDWKGAVIGALTADDVRSILQNYNKGKEAK